MSIQIVGLMGCIAEGLGLLVGIIVFYLFKVTHKRSIGMLFGGTSGLMIAIICFDVLPEALSKNRMDLVLLGTIIGILIGLLLDEMMPYLEERVGNKGGKLSTALVLVIGIAIHNIPEGFALGALAATGTDAVKQFIIILALHSIPEGIAVAIPFKAAQVNLKKIFFIPFILGSIMGIGVILGHVLSHSSESFVVLALGIATGVILYIVCEELLPESRKSWNGRMTTVATILGIILGLVLLGK
ncbi:ZIP family metal transporter [Sporanaerobium hydrogeniformans]|uniref:ZIP family metal transporter n=1 Tax=Sporanaerobium hydrogeniformans TaxID=3072179 RepID=A0AC61DGP1_9FIRM|nr:ZIP family metal transporter [Sporanaerobium hydrogeniformans]PHV72035.1 ZIP family metal transporter [Sporanaerobium hydrogeniformans]